MKVPGRVAFDVEVLNSVYKTGAWLPFCIALSKNLLGYATARPDGRGLACAQDFTPKAIDSET